MSLDALDSLMTSLDVPMAIVTTRMGDERAGCLIGFHAQSSIEPMRYCIWLSKANHTYRVMLRSTHLAVHYLSREHFELARTFGTLSGDDVDKFGLCDTYEGPFGVPLLSACEHRIVARRVALLDEGGDHVCISIEPVDATSAGPFTPLRLSDVDHLEPGHASEERNNPPTERARGA